MGKHVTHDEYVVYWLYDETCSVPENDGYVGITYQFIQRVKTHQRLGRFNPNFLAVVLFTGTSAECAAKERAYRPHPGIGWNLWSGGAVGRKPHATTRVRISAKLTGLRASDETRARQSRTHKKLWANGEHVISAAGKENIRLAHVGNKHGFGCKKSVEEIEKCRQRMLGNKLGHRTKTAQECANISAGLMGKKKSAEHCAKLSAAKRARPLKYDNNAILDLWAVGRDCAEITEALGLGKRVVDIVVYHGRKHGDPRAMPHKRGRKVGFDLKLRRAQFRADESLCALKLVLAQMHEIAPYV